MRTHVAPRLRRQVVLALTVLPALLAAASARADNGVTITAPTDGTSLTTGNPTTVSFKHPSPPYGETYKHTLTIVNKADGKTQYYSKSDYVGSDNPFSVNFTVPTAVKGAATDCTLTVEVTLASDGTSVGSSSVGVSIYTP